MLKGSLSLQKTLVIFFIVVGIVNIGAYFFLYVTFHSDDTRISVASRNGTLSQQIAYYINLHSQGNSNASFAAEQAMQMMDESLLALKEGDIAPGFEDKEMPRPTGNVLAHIEEMEQIWETYKTNAEVVLNAASSEMETPEVQTALQYITNNSELLLQHSNDLQKAILEHAETKDLQSNLFLFGGIILLIISFLATVFYLQSSFLKPLSYFKDKLEQLSKGDYEQQINFSGKSEFNQLSEYMGHIFNKLRLMASFIESIGQGELNFKVDESKKEIVKEDKIFNALEKTRSELIKVEKENEIRQWTNEGIRIISELLQKRHDQVQELYDKLIATIVKYVEGNQGGMFLVNGESENVQLELVSCYAYERKKFLHEKYDVEEGLLGQAFKEKNIIYLTEVPDKYVRITSGLGSSTPDSVLMVPLKDNEAVVGVLELAAFGKIEPYRIEFLEKISELIASALNTIIINEKTRHLLSESQQQAEEMRAQEEEMRQNMEELQATQEEMARKEREITKLLDETSEKEQTMQKLLKEMQGKERFLDSLINVSKDSILAVDKSYKIISFNKRMEETYAGTGVALKKDLNILTTFPDDGMKDNFKAMFDKTFKGESVETTLEVPGENGLNTYYLINYAPIKNEKGDVTASVMYSKDISELVRAQKEAEALLEEAQMNAEEMKAQEEELKQNMEEMAAIQEELEKRANEAEKVKDRLELENAMFSGLMDVLKDRITIKDKKGAYLRVNKVKEESLKKSGIKDYKGKTDADIFGEKHYQESFEVEKKIMETGKGIFDDESKVVSKDGSVLWGSTIRVPFKNDRGEIMGTLVVTRDVTNEKNCEEKLENTEKELQKFKKGK